MQQTIQQHNEVAQRSEQWYRLRLGKFTSSKWYLFETESKTKGEPSDGVKGYIMQLIWELICGHGEQVNVYAMRYGNEWEPFAKKMVQDKYQSEYFDEEFIQHPELPYYGGSADGYIIINGIEVTPEIKCPTGKEHLINIGLLKDVETCKKGWPEIYAQCQSNMNLQGTQIGLPVSFQHEAGPLMYKDLMIPKNDAYIAARMAKMEQAWEWYQKQAALFGVDILAKYAEYAQPPASTLTPSPDITHYAR